MIKAILFDFDGTLIDTNELIFNSYKKAFKEVLNKDIGMEEILSLYGKPLYPSLSIYGEAQEQLYQVYRKYNAENHDILAKPFDGVYDGVCLLKKLGYKMGIVTSKRLPLVSRGIEEILKLDGYFDTIITPDDTEETKPHPEPILLGCKKLGVCAQETIYVGDSVFDMQAGQAANTQLCAVKYSVTPHHKLLEYNPEFFVNTILEFAEKLETV